MNIIKDIKTPVPETIEIGKKIINTVAVSSADAGRCFNLMNIICTKVRNSLKN